MLAAPSSPEPQVADVTPPLAASAPQPSKARLTPSTPSPAYPARQTLPTAPDREAEAAPALDSAEVDSPPAEPAPEFDSGATRNALASVAGQASACRKDGDPSGTANITVTFAPSGRVTSATVQGPPYAGTATGGCIASAMRRASVPAFSGEHITVSKTIVIE